MPKRVSWKKGMRLTDEILKTSDMCSSLLVDKAFAVASAGRFGLCPSPQPFELSVNMSKGVADVETLSCLAITRDGELIDVHYDTRYTNTFDTRVPIPDAPGVKEYILLIVVDREQWRETNDGLEEPDYSFAFVAPDSPVPANAVPIGRIVNDYEWRMDDADFVPPCLFVSAHKKYVELLSQFLDVLAEIDNKSRGLVRSNGKDAVRIFWPVIQSIRITVDKERDTLTPMELLGNVQKCVSAFTCACELDEYLDLADAEAFMSYVHLAYNYKDAYKAIKSGLEICFSIKEKVDKLQQGAPARQNDVQTPVVSDDQLFQNCHSKSISIRVTNFSPEAAVLYSVDGGEPTRKLSRMGTLSIENGFNKMKVPEPDKTVTVKLMAVEGGRRSKAGVFNVTLHKDYKSWDGYEI